MMPESKPLPDISSTTIIGSWHEPLIKVVQKLISELQDVEELNDFLFLTHKCFLIFGKRRQGKHFHPANYIQRYPLKRIVIRDKKIAGRYPARILCTSFIARQLSDAFPIKMKPGELAYKYRGRSTKWKNLPLEKRRSIEDKYMNDNQPYHAIRRSYVNFLLERGLGEVPAFTQTGHSMAIMQQGGTLTLQAPIDLWVEIDKILEKAFQEIGIFELIDILIKKEKKFKAWSISLPAESDTASQEYFRPGEKRFVRQDFSNLLSKSNEFEFEKAIRKNFDKVKKIDPRTQFALLISLEYHIPIQYWVDLYHYFFFNSIVKTNTGSVYFKLYLPQNDAGGIGSAPLFLGKSNEPRVQKILKVYGKAKTQLERKLKNHKGDVLSWKFFKRKKLKKKEKEEEKGISKSLLGNALTQIYKIGWKTHQIEPIQAFTLFAKASITQCFIHHSGIVASSLTGRNLSPLNNASFYDVICIREKQRVLLLNVDETPYQDPFEEGRQPTIQSKQFQSKMSELPLNLTYNQIYPTVEEFARGLSHAQISHQLRRFDQYSLSGSSQAAGRMIRKMILAGFGYPAKAFPLLLPNEIQRLAYLTLEKIKKIDFGDPALNSELQIIFLLCLISGCRVSEAYNMKSRQIKIINKKIYLYLGKGKTNAAQRFINPSEIQWTKCYSSLFIKLFDQYSTFPQIFPAKKNLSLLKNAFKRLHLYHKVQTNSKDKKIRNPQVSALLKKCLKEALGEIFPGNQAPISIHSIRHFYIFHSLQEIIWKHYWHGNFNFALCTFSTQMGHSSFIPTIFSYVGTGCLSLNFGEPSFSNNALINSHD